ncbi:MAG: hypothetical protein GX620_09780 [Chloroflexi bacterium]|nr:hypothetical protein [Chloroflexota bacterium]
MKHVYATVSAIDRYGPWVWITIYETEITHQLAPGRFVMADLDGLPRYPIFPARVTPDTFDVLVQSDHPAACLDEGASLDLIGPMGRGFRYDESDRRWLLIASNRFLSPALGLLQQASDADVSTALLLTAPTATELYPIRWLPPSVEVHVSTFDGSGGFPSSSLDLFRRLVGWADRVFVVTDRHQHISLAQQVTQARIAPSHDFAQALVVPTMICAAGFCQGCAVSVADGVKLACTDGPVFDLLELASIAR